MKTTKAYLISYFELGFMSEDYFETPFLVVKSLETAQNEIIRLQKWIEDTAVTIPKNEYHYTDEKCSARCAEIIEFIKTIEYPYQALNNCFYKLQNDNSLDSHFRINEIVLEYT